MNWGLVLDAGIVVLILGMTYALMSEGLWGAALMFFNVLFAVLVALNFYEPIAKLIAENMSFMVDYADMVSLGLLFTVTVTILRLTTDSLAPIMVRFPNPVFHAGRVTFGFAGAALTVAFLLLLFHTAPVHRRVFGAMTYETRPPFGMGLDHRVLAFFQHTTGYIFPRSGSVQADTEFGNRRVFDRQGRWLIDHEKARPYGTGDVNALDEGSTDAGSAAPASSGEGPGIPGGTAGAAAGLAPTNISN